MAREPETIGIAGLGLLGRGIAACCLGHGLRVVGFTRPDCPHREAEAYLGKAIDELIEKAGFDPALADRWREAYTPVDSLAEFRDCDFVIESVTEDLAVKQEVFDRIEAAVGQDVPIGSNTSAIPITLLQQPRQHPERFVGMHWSEPGHATRFLEVIPGKLTSDAAVTTTLDLARRFGKDPSLVRKDEPGFIVNRLCYAMYREAAHILEEGVADMETIDRSFRNAMALWAGLCGPFRWIDITGGPELYARCMERVMPAFYNDNGKLPALLEKLKQEGALGQKNGRGFYQYDENSPDWQERYHQYVWRMREVMEEFNPLPTPNDEEPR